MEKRFLLMYLIVDWIVQQVAGQIIIRAFLIRFDEQLLVFHGISTFPVTS
jgi:hypothetical protein